MKNTTFLSLLFLCQMAMAQTSDVLSTKIANHWIIDWDSPKKGKGIQYVKKKSNNTGRHLFFNSNGSFTDRYIAKCGLDGNIHQYNGKWRLTENSIIEIYDLTEEYNKAHWLSIYENEKDMVVLPKGKFKILYIDDKRMNIQIIDNYEQKSIHKVKKK